MAVSERERSRRSFLGFLVVQLVVGLTTGSLALLSDAGHMATDAVGLGMALAAIHAASRAQVDSQRTFGLYRCWRPDSLTHLPQRPRCC